MKLLIVDDDLSILESLKLVLDIEGYQTSVLAQGQIVYDTVKKNRPDLIIIDFLLSGTTGKDVVQKLKSDPETKNIPIIMFSAHPSAIKYAHQVGINNFLAKPFELNELLTEIDKLSQI